MIFGSLMGMDLCIEQVGLINFVNTMKGDVDINFIEKIYYECGSMSSFSEFVIHCCIYSFYL